MLARQSQRAANRLARAFSALPAFSEEVSSQPRRRPGGRARW